MHISVAKFTKVDASLYKRFSTQAVVDVGALERLITEFCWSPILWRKGAREKNSYAYSHYAALDFDDGPTIEEIKNKISGIFAIIGTSKSHQKTKDGKPPCDRFRLVMHWERAVESLEEYESNIRRVIRYLGADPACCDGARFFYPCQEIVHRQEGRDIKLAPPEPKKFLQPPATEVRCKLIPTWMQRELITGDFTNCRNSKAFVFSCRLKERRFTEDEALAILSPYITLSHDELRRTIGQAYKHG